MGIFYVKHLLGKNGKLIKTYKIRTMFPDSEHLYDELVKRHGLDGQGKIRNDPRVTIIGKFLRRYWIDEIPQIFTNVLAGDMRLVGVRSRDKYQWDKLPSEHKERALKYKPGLFAVRYLSDSDSYENLIKCEKRYLDELEKHPLITDVKYLSKLIYRILFKGLRSS